MAAIRWEKVGRGSWRVFAGDVFVGWVYRTYRIGRGRRAYMVENTDGQRSGSDWEVLRDAAGHLAIMSSSRVTAAQQ